MYPILTFGGALKNITATGIVGGRPDRTGRMRRGVPHQIRCVVAVAVVNVPSTTDCVHSTWAYLIVPIPRAADSDY